MRLVLIPFILLMFTAVLYQAVALSQESDFGSDVTYANSSSVGAGLVQNGSSTSAEMEGYSMSVGIDPLYGVFVVLIASVAIAVVAGIQVLGSGLSEFSVKMVVKTGLFYCFWLFFSLFAVEAYALFPFGFGWLMYVTMTVVYSFGVVDTVG